MSHRSGHAHQHSCGMIQAAASPRSPAARYEHTPLRAAAQQPLLPLQQQQHLQQRHAGQSPLHRLHGDASGGSTLAAGRGMRRLHSGMGSGGRLAARGTAASSPATAQQQQQPATGQQQQPAADPPLQVVATVEFDNDSDPQSTIMVLCGRNDTALLMSVTAVLTAADVSVASANINTGVDGAVCDIFRVTDSKGAKLPPEAWEPLREKLLRVMVTSSRSSKPSIFGMGPEEDSVATKGSMASEGDARALEAAAQEMSSAAAALVALEREIILLAEGTPSAAALEATKVARSEASSLLERRMAAMQAILAARRQSLEAPKPMELLTQPDIPAFLQPPPMVKTTGPAAGNGYEIILQGFNWESCKEPWYRKLAEQAGEIAEAGFTSMWMPPSSDSVSPQGYLPRDLYDLNSKFGSEAELRECISVYHELGIKVIADIVINHRCAHYQGEGGKWNKFGGRLAWDHTAICSNNAAFAGAGARKSTDDYTAAPNIDHSQERVRRDIAEWMRYLRQSIGFDGWRFDYVKGYEGKWVREYVDATVPEMAFGEYWDTCAYTDGVLNYNQDTHRQRTVDWCDNTGGTTAAFDFTTKGVLQEALGKREYWRLIDGQGRPPGVIGLWPSRAITFLENHDTGSTLNHWPFPWKHAAEGYAYLLTHPGTPCVFYDHFFSDAALKGHILKLVDIRKRYKINAKSEVKICKAYSELYAACIDKKVAMKLGPADWSPQREGLDFAEWKLLTSGPQFAVWGVV